MKEHQHDKNDGTVTNITHPNAKHKIIQPYHSSFGIFIKAYIIKKFFNHFNTYTVKLYIFLLFNKKEISF